jgi:hypothetical protein
LNITLQAPNNGVFVLGLAAIVFVATITAIIKLKVTVTVQADPECSMGMRMTAEGQLLLECR